MSGDREVKIILAFLCILIAFFYGALCVSLQIFPYQWISPYLTAADSVKKALDIDRYAETIRWTKPAHENTGVLTPNAAVPDGYVLYITAHDSLARLIDREGQVVHQWDATYSRIWDNQDHIISLFPLDDYYFFPRDFHLYENGDILLMISAGGVTPWGMGLAKLDQDSKVIWKHTGYANNDFEVGPDGLIYVIEHEIRDKPLKDVTLPFIPFLEDHVVILAPDGQEQKRISLISALENSPYKDTLKQIVDDEAGDPTHSNSIEYVDHDHPSIPWLKKGYLLISVRNINTMLVLDPTREQIVYAYGLISRMQHDVDYLPNGNLMVFDNRGSFTEGGYTRVIEFEPATQEIKWQYDPSPETPFESKFWGAQQRLDNGDTFIVDAESGRLIEVDAAGHIVWEYITPLNKVIQGEKHVPVITHAEYLKPEEVRFETAKPPQR